MTKDNSDAVRDMYFEVEFLEAVFAKQAFILGSHPSAADFGYFASMFRHFGNDPDPAEIMRARAPTHTHGWHVCGTPKRRLWVPSNIECFRKGVTGRRFWTALPMIIFPI